MKTLGLIIIGIGLVTAPSHASVTPAYLAMKQIKAYLEPQLEYKIFESIPPHKAVSHLVGFQMNFARGKYSTEPGGFAQYFGHADATVQVGEGSLYHTVSCDFSADTRVVPFAMQLVPILEEEINGEQLILVGHEIECRLQN